MSLQSIAGKDWSEVTYYVSSGTSDLLTHSVRDEFAQSVSCIDVITSASVITTWVCLQIYDKELTCEL